VPPVVSAEAEANYQRWLASLRPWEPRPADEARQVRPAESERDEPQHAGQRGGSSAGSASGGQAVLERYGEQFFSAIGARGGLTVAHERGPEYLQQIGAKGGAATRQKYGPEHYAAIGRKGGQAGRGRKRTRPSADQPALPLDQSE
jgi:general stress protein YciG